MLYSIYILIFILSSSIKNIYTSRFVRVILAQGRMIEIALPTQSHVFGQGPTRTPYRPQETHARVRAPQKHKQRAHTTHSARPKTQTLGAQGQCTLYDLILLTVKLYVFLNRSRIPQEIYPKD